MGFARAAVRAFGMTDHRLQGNAVAPLERLNAHPLTPVGYKKAKARQACSCPFRGLWAGSVIVFVNMLFNDDF
ncbi:hypothetical protein J3R73_003961 [Labrys monachus]|uniref:Uncharacterized protein n=1 Tax=Labrys monachus TaxID=217067 RepID=A0ABU0FJ83_9HYPH|nr:hypothetical protein [Labrys monachus]